MERSPTYAAHKLDDRQFDDFREIVLRSCGIRLTDDKRELLNARLGRRLRKLDVLPDQYLAMVRRDRAELSRFVDAVSTNHTFFFREARAFEVLDARCRRIWCAAAASGEEPYSLAAYCLSRGIAAEILATDISEACLEKARLGVYPLQGREHIPRPILKQYFQKGRRQWDGFMRVKPELRRKIRFARFNLIADALPVRKFDAIFCRNVMIYFDRPTKEKVVDKLQRALNRDGYFIIGGSESLNGLAHRLDYVAPSVYRNTGS